jgi:hypothetical protein
MSTKVIILNALLDIKANVKKSGVGICSNVMYRIPENWSPSDKDQVRKELYQLFPKWKHYRGDLASPIEGSLSKYYDQNDKFKKTTKYGRLRHNLLNFLIKTVKQELSNVN